MDSLQGSIPNNVGGTTNPQSISKASLLPQNNVLQGMGTSPINLNDPSQTITIQPDCAQQCLLGVYSAAPPAKGHSISANIVGGGLALLAVVIVGIFALKVLRK